MKLPSRSRRSSPSGSACASFRFPAEVILVAVRWYLRSGLSFRDVDELSDCIEADHSRLKHRL